MLNLNRSIPKPQEEPNIWDLVYTLTDDDLQRLAGTIAGLIQGRKQAKEREEQMKVIYAKQAHYDEIENMKPLTIADAAKLLGVSSSTVREMTRRDMAIGGIRCEKIGSRTIIRKDYVDEWIQNNCKSK